MSGDDNEVGFSAELSEKGFSAKVKSRALAAFDFLLAGKAKKRGLTDKRQIAIHDELTATQLSMIGAATRTLTAEIENNPELAQRILITFARAERGTENVQACLTLALDDLSAKPEAAETTEDEPDVLDTSLLARWEHYASGATTEELRERWAHVLSSEIRKPGTFSMKTLRVVDELDASTAQLFERFCKSLIGVCAPCVSLRLSPKELEALEEADLIFQDELPRSLTFDVITKGDDSEWWVMRSGKVGIVIPRNTSLKGVNRSFDDVRLVKDGLAINVIAMTSVGTALSSVVEHDIEDAYKLLASSLKEYVQAEDVKLITNVEGVGWVDTALFEAHQAANSP